MKVDADKIKPIQFMFAVTCFIQSSSLLTSFFMSIVKQDAWIVIVLAFLTSLPVLWTLIALMRAFPQKNLMEINNIVFGRVGGKIVSLFYLWFFMTLAALNSKDMSVFVRMSIMPNTPIIFVLVTFIFVCALAVRNGVRVLTRYSIVFSIIAAGIALITTFLTFDVMNPENFLPMFQLKPIKYVQATHIITTIPFGEIIVFMMITPNINVKPEKIGKYFAGGFIIGAASLLIIVLRDTAVLGNTVVLFSMPSFETLRMASLTPSISRLEILFAIALIILFFFKISLLYYITVLAIKEMFRLGTFRSLVLSVGAIIIMYSIIVHSTAMHNRDFGSETAPFMWIFIEFILPLVTLIIAKLRKTPQKYAESALGEAH